MTVEKYGWAVQKKLICVDQSGFYFLTHLPQFKNA